MAHAPVAETPVRDAKTAESGAKTAQFDPIAGGPCHEKRAANRDELATVRTGHPRATRHGHTFKNDRGRAAGASFKDK